MVVRIYGHAYIYDTYKPIINDYWISTIGGTSIDEGYSVDTDNNGNIYVAGRVESSGGSGGSDAIIIKLNQAGDILWQKSIGGTWYESSDEIWVDKNNNCLYVIGSLESEISNSESDYFIVKYDLDGNVLWQRSFGEDWYEEGRSLATDSTGNVYLVGYSDSDSANASYDTFIVKYSSSGNLVWQKKYEAQISNPSYDDSGNGIAFDSDDNFYVTGLTTSYSPEGTKIFVSKFDSDANIIWQKLLNGAGNSSAFGIKIDTVGNIFVLGYTTVNSEGAADIILIKLNPQGSIMWQRILGSSSNENGYELALDNMNNAYIIGQSNSTSGVGQTDVVIAKYNPFGVLQWQRFIGSTSYEYGYGITIDKFNNIVFTGRSSTLGSTDILVGKIDTKGETLGSWSGWEIKASNLIDKNGALVVQDMPSLISNSSFLDEARTLTITSRSLTVTKVNLT